VNGHRTHYLDVTVTEDDLDRALGAASHSGRCMIAQAIRVKFGAKSRPIVDSDYIRFTLPATGERLLYRTPPDAQAALISFDAGIRPRLPLRIHTRIAFQKRSKRPSSEAPIREVRAWAATQPQFANTKPEGKRAGGRLPRPVIDAFLAAHPGRTVRQGPHTVSTSASHTLPKTVLPAVSSATPPIGNLAGGRIPPAARVPQSRRRTWGSRQMTTVLLEQGWSLPGDEAK
jgi:hypothetical protein